MRLCATISWIGLCQNIQWERIFLALFYVLQMEEWVFNWITSNFQWSKWVDLENSWTKTNWRFSINNGIILVNFINTFAFYKLHLISSPKQSATNNIGIIFQNVTSMLQFAGFPIIQHEQYMTMYHPSDHSEFK